MDVAKCKSLLTLTEEEIQEVPKSILLDKFSHEIEAVFEHLSEDLRSDPEVQGYLFCYKHCDWYSEGDTSRADEVSIPTKNCCETCLKEEEQERYYIIIIIIITI